MNQVDSMATEIAAMRALHAPEGQSIIKKTLCSFIWVLACDCSVGVEKNGARHGHSRRRKIRTFVVGVGVSEVILHRICASFHV
jgi:hypothetical protein